MKHPFSFFPPTVEYAITPHGQSLGRMMEELHYWELAHRKEVIGG